MWDNPSAVLADNDFQYTLNVKGRLSTPEEFGDIILRVEDQGKVLRLKDVAKIELGSAGYGVVSRLKGNLRLLLLFTSCREVIRWMFLNTSVPVWRNWLKHFRPG